MKRLILFFFIGAFVVTSTVASAIEKAPLGSGNFAVKTDYIGFTDDYFDRNDNQDDGLYLGIEGYGKITPNLYLGGEIGIGFNMEGREEIHFIPVELNMKYAIEAARDFVVDVGAGFSYSSVEIQYTSLFGTDQKSRSDWLFGGQVFADLTYQIHRFTIGFNGKYQITEDFKGEGIDLSNFRLGVQMGMVF